MDTSFNEDQIDALREFINISLGAASSNIAELLNAFSTMHVPKISICNSDELVTIVESEIDKASMYYVSKQLFSGEFGGECLFVIREEEANNLGNHLYDVQNPSQDDITDAVMELTNILTSTIISRLTEEFNTEVQFFVPSSQFQNANNIVENEDINYYSKIIIVSTILDFKDQKINGDIYILTKDESILSLKKLIDDKLKELYS